MGSWWQQIGAGVAGQFSDLPAPQKVARLAVRLLVAAILGGVLGYERERAGKPAGIRTHMLVALGAAMFVVVPQQSGAGPGDMTRVLQGVVTGIGFLGAGAILKKSDEEEIVGLTTAAGVWLTAAIGVAAGMGHGATAVFSTVLALIVLEVVPLVASWTGRGRGDRGPR